MHNFRLQKIKFKFKNLIDYIAINLWSSENFASMEDIKRKCKPIVNLSKFTSNKKILNEVITLSYNQVCCETLSFNMYL